MFVVGGWEEVVPRIVCYSPPPPLPSIINEQMKCYLFFFVFCMVFDCVSNRGFLPFSLNPAFLQSSSELKIQHGGCGAPITEFQQTRMKGWTFSAVVQTGSAYTCQNLTWSYQSSIIQFFWGLWRENLNLWFLLKNFCKTDEEHNFWSA